VSELDPSARALLDAVRDTHDPTDEDRTSTQALLEQRLGPAAFLFPAAATSPWSTGAAKVAGSATTQAAVTGSVAKGTLTGLAGLLLAKPVLLTLGAVVTAGVTWSALQTHDARSVAPHRTPDATPRQEHVEYAPFAPPRAVDEVASAPGPVAQPEPRTPPLPSTPATLPTPTPQPARQAPSTGPVSGDRAAEKNTLGDEAHLLSQVFHAMQSGAPERALSLLDEHAARYPEGTMRAEASTERVLALCSLGRVEEARSEGARFLRSFPTDPLVTRVRSSCAFTR
jgi:hypothetical protein